MREMEVITFRYPKYFSLNSWSLNSSEDWTLENLLAKRANLVVDRNKSFILSATNKIKWKKKGELTDAKKQSTRMLFSRNAECNYLFFFSKWLLIIDDEKCLYVLIFINDFE
jgi:hypothetical protein